MKIIVLGKVFSHGIQTSSQLIFPGNGVNSRNIVDTLVKMHANEGMRGN